MTTAALINKYNVPGPRYTSYPTVPYWKDAPLDIEAWKSSLIRSFSETNAKEGISLYIHLPFCESLCTFCACHKRITKRHSVEQPYIETLLKEWSLYLELLPEKPRIKEIHLGGGTPTFFSPENLEHLLTGILDPSNLAPNYSFSFEGHPNNTTKEHLECLHSFGFRRVSYGVQDYDPLVQRTINRIQPFEEVKQAVDLSRNLGFKSIGQDLVFGLPHQGAQSIRKTIELTRELRPDRIAYYSYAHVPWIKNNGQRGFSEADLPSPEEKRELYEIGKELLYESGYEEIGMDHFALKSDSLYQAVENRKLHRNFMGYTENDTSVMIGLGMSAISDSWYAFAQNAKSLEEYTEIVNRGALPVFRGHILDEEDLVIRRHILNLMCHMETDWSLEEDYSSDIPGCLARLSELEKDGLVDISSNGLKVPEHARPFMRNICMAFDLHMHKNQPDQRIFSMTV